MFIFWLVMYVSSVYADWHFKMSWPSPMEFHYANSGPGMPYNSIGSFMDFFGGLTYDHVNFIFADSHPYAQVLCFCYFIRFYCSVLSVNFYCILFIFWEKGSVRLM